MIIISITCKSLHRFYSYNFHTTFHRTTGPKRKLTHPSSGSSGISYDSAHIKRSSSCAYYFLRDLQRWSTSAMEKSDSRKPAANSFHGRPWNDATRDCVNVTQRASRTTASERSFSTAYGAFSDASTPICLIQGYIDAIAIIFCTYFSFHDDFNNRSWSFSLNFFKYYFVLFSNVR